MSSTCRQWQGRNHHRRRPVHRQGPVAVALLRPATAWRLPVAARSSLKRRLPPPARTPVAPSPETDVSNSGLQSRQSIRQDRGRIRPR